MPILIIKNKVVSLIAPLTVLKALLLEEYLQKASTNSLLPSAVSLLLLLVCSLFSPPVYIQEDFNKVFYGINNPRTDAAGVITSNIIGGNIINSNMAAVNPTDLNLNSVDFF